MSFYSYISRRIDKDKKWMYTDKIYQIEIVMINGQRIE